MCFMDSCIVQTAFSPLNLNSCTSPLWLAVMETDNWVSILGQAMIVLTMACKTLTQHAKSISNYSVA